MGSPSAAKVCFAAFIVVGVLLGLLLATACSENLDPGTTRKQVCDAVAENGVRWWLAVLWPAAVFTGFHFLLRRKHVLMSVVITVALMAAFWIPLLLIV